MCIRKRKKKEEGKKINKTQKENQKMTLMEKKKKKMYCGSPLLTDEEGPALGSRGRARARAGGCSFTGDSPWTLLN
jgi:hypothetical protein